VVVKSGSSKFAGGRTWSWRMETVNTDCGKTALFRPIVNINWQVRKTILLKKGKAFFFQGPM
jgi:hypothetical protein